MILISRVKVLSKFACMIITASFVNYLIQQVIVQKLLGHIIIEVVGQGLILIPDLACVCLKLLVRPMHSKLAQ